MNKPQILIVDDDIAIRSMLSFVLQEQGFDVQQAISRKQAIDILEKKPDIKIIILDLGMPPAEHDMSEGLAVLEEAQKNFFGIKVIVLTGQDQQQAAYKSITLGAFDFLAKPVEEKALLASVNRAILFLQQEQDFVNQTGKRKLLIDAPVGKGLKDVRNNAEKKLVAQVLKETGFNIHETARVLGIKRENVYYLMKKYHISRD